MLSGGRFGRVGLAAIDDPGNDRWRRSSRRLGRSRGWGRGRGRDRGFRCSRGGSLRRLELCRLLLRGRILGGLFHAALRRGLLFEGGRAHVRLSRSLLGSGRRRPRRLAADNPGRGRTEIGTRRRGRGLAASRGRHEYRVDAEHGGEAGRHLDRRRPQAFAPFGAEAAEPAGPPALVEVRPAPARIVRGHRPVGGHRQIEMAVLHPGSPRAGGSQPIGSSRDRHPRHPHAAAIDVEAIERPAPAPVGIDGRAGGVGALLARTEHTVALIEGRGENGLAPGYGAVVRHHDQFVGLRRAGEERQHARHQQRCTALRDGAHGSRRPSLSISLSGSPRTVAPLWRRTAGLASSEAQCMFLLRINRIGKYDWTAGFRHLADHWE